jgi:hypothetical protein
MRRSSNGRAVPLQGTDRGSIPLRRTKCPDRQIGKVVSLKRRNLNVSSNLTQGTIWDRRRIGCGSRLLIWREISPCGFDSHLSHQ